MFRKSQPTGRMRWRKRRLSEVHGGDILQQEWEIIEREHICDPESRAVDWRDVPTAETE